MRTTVTLDADTVALLRRFMRERGLTFKEAINSAICAGLGRTGEPRFETPTFHMGFEAAIPWHKALRLAGELEDEELTRKLAARK